MQKKNRSFLRSLVFSALCAALSVVLGKYLQIPVGNSLRISFESLPVLLASLAVGPFWGALTGLVADLVGCLLVGYEINPIITLGMVCVGLLPACLILRKDRFFSVFWPILVAHAVGNMCVKSLGLYLWYATPWPILLARVGISCATAVLESLIIYELMKRSRLPFWKGEKRA